MHDQTSELSSAHPGTARNYAALLAKVLPSSLLGRLSVVMVAGVMLTQLAGNFIWATQLRAESQAEARTAAQHLAHSASAAVRFVLSLPQNYRPLIIQQFREMGGTRFFININSEPVMLPEFGNQTLAAIAVQQISATIKEDLPAVSQFQVGFAWPDKLIAMDDGTRIADMPESWVRHILLTTPNPAPILVIQARMDAEHWLYLAALMPNPYFLESGNPLTRDRVLLQALSLAAVLLLSILVVRWTTRPLAALSEAAAAFGNGENMPALPETGSREFVNTARAFSAMAERIQRYIEDRERLFVSISHDLRTPIMRLKLRAELLDDDELRAEFHDDLDDLDMMVKGALQCVKDSDIHENPTEIRLDAFIGRLVRGAQLAGHQVLFEASGLSLTAKPLALKRAIGNLLDNALHYGTAAQISVTERDGNIEIEIRDHGPGVPEEALAKLFDPYVRLEHGRYQNSNGMGLGLGIAQSIVHAHGGQLLLANHSDGGLVARLILPADFSGQL
ncbi:HAMP domain-containing protein [Undibacterium piscinae]|uniref:histidine kinase n=1 Tax=Undibacterium piscinae TaxID=2495591 RepID=A0A6M4AAB2_9BURK|nr:HAMP domain-containing protein [Undibacterium piscinae]